MPRPSPGHATTMRACAPAGAEVTALEAGHRAPGGFDTCIAPAVADADAASAAQA